VLSFGALAVLARRLGPDAYGVMGMAALLTNFLQTYRDLGTTTALIQRREINQKLLSSVFWLNLISGGVLALIVIGLAVPASRFFHQPKLTPIMWVLAASFPITAASMVHSALLSRNMRFDSVALSDFGSSLAGYLVAIPCAYAGLGVWSLVFANIANAVGGSGLLWFSCKWRPCAEFDYNSIRSIAGFSLNLSGFATVNYFSRNADNLVVGRILGSMPLGCYQMAYNMMLFPIQNISAVIAQVLFPGFARIQDDDERFRSAYLRGCMLIGLITFPVIAGLGIVAGPLVHAMLGAKWVSIIPLFQILVPVGLIQSVQTTNGQIFTAKGRTDWMFRWGLFASLILVSSFIVGVHWGVTGVAVAYAISYGTLLAYLGFAVPFRLIGLNVGDFLKAFVPQLAITAGMVAGCAALQLTMAETPAIVQLVTSVLAGAVIYSGLMLWLRPPVVYMLLQVTEHLPFPGFSRGLRHLVFRTM
ncbi:MAG: MOP flippase family protein, partial [Acidobacteriaceae bacterium]|nr:MOP flippase family protein [Acidobacteriaceae bacterium]